MWFHLVWLKSSFILKLRQVVLREWHSSNPCRVECWRRGESVYNAEGGESVYNAEGGETVLPHPLYLSFTILMLALDWSVLICYLAAFFYFFYLAAFFFLLLLPGSILFFYYLAAFCIPWKSKLIIWPLRNQLHRAEKVFILSSYHDSHITMWWFSYCDVIVVISWCDGFHIMMWWFSYCDVIVDGAT